MLTRGRPAAPSCAPRGQTFETPAVPLQLLDHSLPGRGAQATRFSVFFAAFFVAFGEAALAFR